MDARAVMPFYLALDTSAAAQAFIGAYDGELRAWQRELVLDRPAGESLRLSILTMASDHCRATPLATIDRLQRPSFHPSGATSGVDTMLRAVRNQIDDDLDQLQRDSFRAFRPALIVLLATDPTGEWRESWRELTAYDAWTNRGNRRYPAVVPISLARTTVAAELAHPRGQAPSVYPSRPCAPSQTVSAAFIAARHFMTASLTTLTRGRPAHRFDVLAKNGPTSRQPSETVASNARRRADRHPIPGTAERRQERPSTRQSAFVQIDCARTGESTAGHFVLHGTTWLLTASARHKGAPDSTDALVDLKGGFDIDPEFAGCARCGNRSYVKCPCGHLGCWDGTTIMYTCSRCRSTSPVTERIRSLSPSIG